MFVKFSLISLSITTRQIFVCDCDATPENNNVEYIKVNIPGKYKLDFQTLPELLSQIIISPLLFHSYKFSIFIN